MIDAEPISVVHPLNVAENTSFEEDELSPVGPFVSTYHEVGDKSKAAGKRNLLLMRLEGVSTKGSKGSCPGELRQDRVAVVTKVVPDAAMKLVHSDEMGVLVARLFKASIIHGRCMAFEEVAELKEPFVLEKMPNYRPFLKEVYDRAGDDMVNPSYPFLTELIADLYAFVEQLLSKKPRSL
ncbi:hypothetical protein Tco_1108897 [Tanacetum coccineum]